MSDAKHTPSPWRVEQGTTLVWGACNPDDATTYGMGFPVAEARTIRTHGGVATIEEAEANARLIAAAPELLAALKGILEDDAHTTSLADQRARWTTRMAAAAAAIAKAEGRT